MKAYIDKEFQESSSKLQVFSNVVASLSPEMIELLPDQKADYLQDELGMLKLLIYYENDSYIVSGHIEEVYKCYHKLRDCVRNLNEVTGDFKESDSENTVVPGDSSGNCENSSRRIIIRESVADDTASEEEEPDSGKREHFRTAISKKGRVIKTPKRFGDSLLCADDSDEDFLSDSESDNEHIADNEGTATDLSILYNRSAATCTTDLESVVAAGDKKETSAKETLAKEKVSDKVPVEMEWIKSMRYVARERLNKKSKDSIPEANDSDGPRNVGLKVVNNKQMASESGTAKTNVQKKEIPQTKMQVQRQVYEKKLPFKYYCDKCSFKCKRESHFQKHTNLHNNNPDLQIHRCDTCAFTSIRRSVLNMHKLKHEAMNLMKCKDCTYSTNDKQKLRRHIKNRRHNAKDDEYESDRPILRCHMCVFKTTAPGRFNRHLENHGINILKLENDTKFICDVCGYTTIRKEHMARHKRDVHTNTRPHLCDICGASFKRVDTLRQHKITHMDKSNRRLPFGCFKCKKSFRSQAHLKEHLPVHSEIRAHLCDICGTAFKTKAVVKKHQKTIHFNPGSYRCSVCPKGFNTKYALKRHIRVHDNDIVEEPTRNEPRLLDENTTAIQTITISADQLPQFTQQLQSVSQQLQSATDVGEIYIHGGGAGGEMFVHAQGEELQISNQGAGLQYYITTDGIGDHAIVQIDGQQLVQAQGHTLIAHDDQGQALIEHDGQVLIEQGAQGQALIEHDGQALIEQGAQGQTLLALKSSDVENL